MKVVLTNDVPKLGRTYDIVAVKNGFARNWLLPQGLAIPYSAALEADIEKMQAEREKERTEVIENAEKYVKELEKITLEFVSKANQEGVLFGSVSAEMLAGKLSDEHKITLNTKDFAIEEGGIKQVGTHKVQVKLGEQAAELKVKVVAE